jgi:hypothetical protein
MNLGYDQSKFKMDKDGNLDLPQIWIEEPVGQEIHDIHIETNEPEVLAEAEIDLQPTKDSKDYIRRIYLGIYPDIASGSAVAAYRIRDHKEEDSDLQRTINLHELQTFAELQLFITKRQLEKLKKHYEKHKGSKSATPLLGSGK